jgi:hypothetical protein
VKPAEEQYHEFQESKEPRFLKIARSARPHHVSRHQGEGIEVMMHRLQGTKPSMFRPGLPTVRGLLKKGEERA